MGLRAARRPDAAAPPDLRQRRAWFDGTDDPPADDKGGKKPDKEEIPDWVKDPEKAYAELQRARQEAAQHRTKLRELEQAETQRQQDAQKAKEKELADQGKFKPIAEQREQEIEQLKRQLAEAQTGALRTKIALELGLTPVLADRLKGATEDELRADAAELAKLLPAAPKPGQQKDTSALPGGAPAGKTEAQLRADFLSPSGRSTTAPPAQNEGDGLHFRFGG